MSISVARIRAGIALTAMAPLAACGGGSEAPVRPLATPVGVVANLEGDTLNVSWSPVAMADGYVASVEHLDADSGALLASESFETDAPSLKVPDIRPNSRVVIQVQATRGAEISRPSAPALAIYRLEAPEQSSDAGLDS